MKMPPSTALARPILPICSSRLRDAALVLAVAWLARLAFMLTMPPAARSFDAHSWETVAQILDTGKNPYEATSLLNWPPLWMELIFVISKISTALSIPFFRCLQLFLILVESAVMVSLINLIREAVPEARVRTLVILALALNPAAILLTCQHCNFDVIVALSVVLFLSSLLRFGRTRDHADWLCACLFLGLGILAKTVPLVLVPLLAGGFRKASNRLRLLGLALLFGPVALGVSIIYVLAPADVSQNVFGYRSAGGTFGFSGLFQMAGVGRLGIYYNWVFYAVLAAVMVWSVIFFWRRQSIGGRETVLVAALLLAGIPALGPGYAPQYLYWFMPLLIATFSFFKGAWRLMLAGFALIAAGTYVVEYALFPSHGMFLFRILTNESKMDQAMALMPVMSQCSSPTGQTLIRLPMFIAYLTLLAFGCRLLVRNVRHQSTLE
jgi:hypothetical protein